MKQLLALLNLSKRVTFATSQEEFDQQATDFLLSYGFEDTAEYRKLFGALVQHSGEDDNTFDPNLMARRIRKQKANEYAFYVIYPEKKQTKTEASSDESGKPESATKEVV